MFNYQFTSYYCIHRYFRGAQAAIVVYDITSPDTFKRAQAWVKELRQQANQNIVIALAGNKADLSAQRTVENEVSRNNPVKLLE